ncbi:beta-eliminating lyase-related protein [Sorangium sp. So ce1504]|uniref:threonine aldolase family protein n=1 Tax=Sorangium sp. So ce1504 TaxID=3133337 RepID=UPI003F5E5F9F
MIRRDDEIEGALRVIADHFGAPPWLLRRVLEGYGSSSAGDSVAGAAEPGKIALRTALAGSSLRALSEQLIRRDLGPYARDRITKRLSETLAPFFGPGVWLPCPSATAAGAVAARFLAGSGPGALFAEDVGHAMILEAGAVTVMSGGQLFPVAIRTDERGTIRLEDLEDALLAHCPRAAETTLGRDHFPTPRVLLLSWPSLFGFAPSIDELRALRAACDREGMKLALDLVWGPHKLAEDSDPLPRLLDLMGLADAVTFSLPKIDCGPGAFVFFPRAEEGSLDRLRASVKPIGLAEFEAWETSARWEAAWTSHRALLWETLRSHVDRAARIRAELGSRGFVMSPESAGNVVFLSTPPETAEVFLRHGAGRWPLRCADRGHVMLRLMIASWYPPGWEDRLFDGLAGLPAGR